MEKGAQWELALLLFSSMPRAQVRMDVMGLEFRV